MFVAALPDDPSSFLAVFVLSDWLRVRCENSHLFPHWGGKSPARANEASIRTQLKMSTQRLGSPDREITLHA